MRTQRSSLLYTLRRLILAIRGSIQRRHSEKYVQVCMEISSHILHGRHWQGVHKSSYYSPSFVGYLRLIGRIGREQNLSRAGWTLNLRLHTAGTATLASAVLSLKAT